MLAVARSPALNASAPDALVRSDAPSPACIPEKEYIDRSLTNFRIGLININGLTSDKFNNLITYTQDMALDANILTGGGGSMGGSIGRPDSSRPASACAVQVSMSIMCGPSGNAAGMPRPRLFAADSSTALIHPYINN